MKHLALTSLTSLTSKKDIQLCPIIIQTILRLNFISITPS